MNPYCGLHYYYYVHVDMWITRLKILTDCSNFDSVVKEKRTEITRFSRIHVK